jgi:hypothetical protein
MTKLGGKSQHRYQGIFKLNVPDPIPSTVMLVHGANLIKNYTSTHQNSFLILVHPLEKNKQQTQNALLRIPKKEEK